MRFAIIIPARFASTRYPGKPLAMLCGVNGAEKPLVQRSWECAREIAGAAGVWVATDDQRIADVVRGFGGQVVMTSPDCRNGTERCADAVSKLGAKLGESFDAVVNLQGDAPLTPTHVVGALVEALAADPAAAMTTVAVRCSPTTYAHLVGDQAAGRVGGTTVVTTTDGRALYFSKRVIPYVSPLQPGFDADAVRLHLGLYAYRPEALAAYAQTLPSPLEDLEGLEQLRFLEAGQPVRVVTFDPVGWDCIELNNPEDITAIERVLLQRGID
ncbi:3-deoxy-manno-octulosonate cytidylyltransferase [Novosphingobium sp.]|uniref:3-deoxy-manno-octulosonate cytidylyltransferase n=1 Tax=Novosphingobium sp. TaxID=1874826 RepID=UPI0025D061CE|nr:3-deoxy-manno-octulosonate cytidylyltransferase [Novosphingobium sp.]